MKTTSIRAVPAAVGMLLLASCTQPVGPGLGEVMSLQQMRHAKLWFAGQAENWELADYELDELEEGFADVLTYHPTHKSAPQPLTILLPRFVDAPIREMRSATAAHDQVAFEVAHDHLTQACNACHQATQFGFNVVQRPDDASWFANQDFTAQPASDAVP